MTLLKRRQTLDTNLARSQFVVSLIWSNICTDGGKQISVAQEGGYQSGEIGGIVIPRCLEAHAYIPILIGIRAEGGVQLRAGNERTWPGTLDRSSI